MPARFSSGLSRATIRKAVPCQCGHTNTVPPHMTGAIQCARCRGVCRIVPAEGTPSDAAGSVRRQLVEQGANRRSR